MTMNTTTGNQKYAHAARVRELRALFSREVAKASGAKERLAVRCWLAGIATRAAHGEGVIAITQRGVYSASAIREALASQAPKAHPAEGSVAA